MTEEFIIETVTWEQPQSPEFMGTKEKFWFNHNSLGHCLFKYTRENTGEDWAEKIAAELCQMLELPHAKCEFATCNNKRGIITPTILVEGSELVHGNELLVGKIPSYSAKDSKNKFHMSKHTLERVLEVIDNPEINLPLDWQVIDGINKAVEVFVGYLMLDALIGNTDRHHENWAVVECVEDKGQEVKLIKYLAPTYDHGSSLGRNEPDDKKRARLESKDKQFNVEAYASKAISAFYYKEGDRRPLSTIDAFVKVANLYPKAASIWLNRLKNIKDEDISGLLNRIPKSLISSISIEFVEKVLYINRNKLTVLL